MTEHREYDEATKAAVLAALLTGQSVGQVASKYNIPKGTVKYWKSQVQPTNPVDPQKRERIGELLWEYLQASLISLRIQAEHFGDKEWLNKQNAADSGVLHGIGIDKAIRLLEAFDSSEEKPEG